jgi:hypothetical protein
MRDCYITWDDILGAEPPASGIPVADIPPDISIRTDRDENKGVILLGLALLLFVVLVD